MSILAWLLLGGLAGWIAGAIVIRNSKLGVIGNVVVGCVGALIGGWLFTHFGGHGVSGFNLYSLFVAVVGASLLLWIVKLVR